MFGPIRAFIKISVRTLLCCHIVWLTLNESIYWMLWVLTDYGENCQLYCGKIDWIWNEQQNKVLWDKQCICLYLFSNITFCLRSWKNFTSELYIKTVIWIYDRFMWRKVSGEILSSVLIKALNNHNVMWIHQDADSHSTF